jgi:hypothetical protein
MRPSHRPIPPVDPCDATALDAIVDLTEAQFDALTAADPADSTRRADMSHSRLPGIPGWRLHVPTSILPACHLLPYP